MFHITVSVTENVNKKQEKKYIWTRTEKSKCRLVAKLTKEEN